MGIEHTNKACVKSARTISSKKRTEQRNTKKRSGKESFA